MFGYQPISIFPISVIEEDTGIEIISIDTLTITSTLQDVNVNEHISVDSLSFTSVQLNQIGALDGNRDPIIIITE